MDAALLLSRLVSEGLAEEIEPAEDCVASARLGDLEVSAAGNLPSGALRKRLAALWKMQVGSTGRKVLLVADDREGEGRVAALGPSTAEQGPFAGPAERLLSLLRDFRRGDGDMEAFYRLVGALERMGTSRIPGVIVRGLLTEHTLERLRDDGDRTRWDEARRLTASLDADDDWEDALRKLGYTPERRSGAARGRLLRSGDGSGSGRVALVLPFAEAADFDRFDEENRPREGLLGESCRVEGVRYGLLASGGRMRLFRFEIGPGAGPGEGARETVRGASGWIEFDLEQVDEQSRPFLALLAPPSLAEGGFEKELQNARDNGVALWKRLDRRLRDQALPALAGEMARWAKKKGLDLSIPREREELEQASLTLCFRLLFLFYAESAGYLPLADADYRKGSLTELVEEARRKKESLDDASESLWLGFVRLVRAMRRGNRAWGVPAYNGALFAETAFAGAETLESFSMGDPGFGRMLTALGWDEEGDCGVDYSTIEIGHLGHLYESLLSRHLTLTTRPVAYDAKSDRYRPMEDPKGNREGRREGKGNGEGRNGKRNGNAGEDAVPPGSLLWQTHLGGRKAGGVYYTPTALVRHLVERAVAPAFEKHLEEVRKLADTDPKRAAERLLDFAVLDPACGSAHFLVEVLDALANRTARFLAERPLPALSGRLLELRGDAEGPGSVSDLALLRRLLLKHCLFGVDVSPMGAEIATMSLWLAAFVPGLALSYLGRNVVAGNALIGVADWETVVKKGSFEEHELRKALRAAAESLAEVAGNPDRTAAEYDRSRAADLTARTRTGGLQQLFDLWVAEPEAPGSRNFARGRGKQILEGPPDEAVAKRVEIAEEAAKRLSAFHWPLWFPHLFVRERPGFDAVVGNPPWEEVTVEELSLYVMENPGLNTLPQRERESVVGEMDERDPTIRRRVVERQERSRAERRALASGEYEGSAGDPDLYKYFCQRYRRLLREGGAFGVVLPRSAFSAKGSERFREWLYERMQVDRVDTLLNRRRWIFDTHPQYSVALVAAENSAPGEGHAVEVAGTADSEAAWKEQVERGGVRLATTAFGPGYQTPLARSQEEADLLERVRRGSRFPHGSGNRWWCFPVRELDETNDAHFWRGKTSGQPLWKGESFDQYEPTGRGARRCPSSAAVLKKIRKPSPGSGSLLRRKSKQARRFAVRDELERARIAFRDVTNRTNSRTVIACLVPPKVLLTNTAPYLAFLRGKEREQAACLGLMNSAPFEWQARRFVELHLSFFVLEGLFVPDLDDDDFGAIAKAAGRLSAVDDRFADFARATGVECGPLEEDERLRLRAELDARVARAWKLDSDDLDLVFSDFTEAAVPNDYRALARARLQELGG